MNKNRDTWPGDNEPTRPVPNIAHDNAQPYAPHPSGQGPYARPWPGDGRGQQPPTGSSGTPPKSGWSKKKTLLAGAGVLLFGIIIGSCGASGGTETTSTPAPTETETVEVPGPERVVEKEVEVPVTPDSCLEALDLAEQGFDLASQTISIMNDALQAAANLNVAGIESATAQLEVLQPELESIVGPMNEAKAECRAS